MAQIIVNGKPSFKSTMTKTFDITKPLEFLVEDYLLVRSESMVFGGSEEFKTFHLMSWAYHIATGIQWNDKKVTQAPVVMLVGEGEEQVYKRLVGLEKKYDTVATDFFLESPEMDLTLKEDVDWVISYLQEAEVFLGRPVGLLILDHLSRFMSGNESDSTATKAYASAIRRIRQTTGVAVLTVHHTGKDSDKGARGSKNIRDSQDSMFLVKRPNMDELDYNLIVDKQKDFAKEPPISVKLVGTTIAYDTNGKPVTTLVPETFGEAIRKATKKSKGPSLSDLCMRAILSELKDGKVLHKGFQKTITKQGHSNNSFYQVLNKLKDPDDTNYCVEESVEDNVKYFRVIDSVRYDELVCAHLEDPFGGEA